MEVHNIVQEAVIKTIAKKKKFKMEKQLSQETLQIAVKRTEWESLEIFSRKLDTKGTFRAKIGSIKDRNGMDLTEAEHIKNKWQEYTEKKLYKKDLNDPDNH